MTIEDLSRPVIGRLGLPLGTAAEIRARIADGSTFGSKGADGRYFLEVLEVDGRLVAKPGMFKFHVLPWSSAKLASNNFALYELKKGEKAGALTSGQIAELKRGYVGTEVRLGVYEAGGFSGIPDRLPKGALDWADHGFGFSTWLEVTIQRE